MAMTDDQKRAIAIAKARRRKAEQQTAPEVGMAEGMFNAATDSAAFSFGDELEGAIDGVMFGKMPGKGYFNYSTPMDERYQANADAFRAKEDAFAESNPGLDVTARIAGGLATGMGAGKAGMTLLKPGMSTTGALGRGAVEGAAYGGAYGAGEADEGDRLSGAIYGGGVGAAVGGPMAAGTQKVLNALTNRATKAAAPSVQDLKRQGGQLLDDAWQTNATFPDFDQYALQSYSTLPQEGYHPNLHPRAKAVLDRIEELSRKGPDVEYRDLSNLRKLMASAAGSPEAEERRIGMMLRNGLDNYMETTAAANPSIPGMETVKEGRQLWARAKKGERIDKAMYSADLGAASSGSGGNIENQVRQQFKAILKSDKQRRGFNADEIEMMERIVRGEPVQNFLRLAGKLSPQGNGLMAALGLGATAMNPAMVAFPAAGLAAKRLADGRTMSNAALLDALVRSGGQKPQPMTTPTQGALIRALSGYLGGETGGAMAQVP